MNLMIGVYRNVCSSVDDATGPKGLPVDCSTLEAERSIQTVLTAARVKAIKLTYKEVTAIFLRLKQLAPTPLRSELLCEMVDMKLITRSDLSEMQGVDATALDGVLDRTLNWRQHRGL